MCYANIKWKFCLLNFYFGHLGALLLTLSELRHIFASCQIVLGDNTILLYIRIFTYDIVFKLQYRHIVFQDFCVFGVIYPYLCNSLMEVVVKLNPTKCIS